MSARAQNTPDRLCDGDEIRLVLDSRLEYLDAVHRLSEEFGRFAGLGREDAFRLSLAVREALANALTHGNRLDEHKKVRLSYRVRGGTVCVCVADEGSGFRPEDAPDPLAPENLDRPEGRGLLLMRHYVDKVEVRRAPGRGTRLCLHKHLPERGRRRSVKSGRKHS
ncbi:MAG: ATP-binding protein [Acidobacteriota bacterium]